MSITSLQNPRVKRVVHLRQRRAREREGRFLVDGQREVLRAAMSGVRVEEVFFCLAASDATGRNDLRVAFAGLDTTLLEVTPAVFEKISYGDRRDGMVAVVQVPRRQLEDLALGDDPLVVVLESVEKPGNVGAILRTADAVGAAALVVADPATELYNPNAVRASLGAIFSVPVCASSSEQALRWLRRSGIRVIAARVDGAVSYPDAPLAGPCAIVIGSEAKGLSPVWTGDDVTPVALPMRGIVDSLNVSATAAVLLYEALRQRGLR